MKTLSDLYEKYKFNPIGWCHFTWNFWWGCVHHGPACLNCYAESFSGRFTPNNVWGKNAPRRVFKESHYNVPQKWLRAANELGQFGIRPRVFVGSMMDWAEEYNPNVGYDDPNFEVEGVKYTWDINPYRKIIFDRVENTPELDFLLLTKRSENIAKMVPESWMESWPENCWPMVSVGTPNKLYRMEDLIRIPSKVRSVSLEPLVAPLGDIRQYLGVDLINHLVIGGESQQRGKARKMEYDWVLGIIEQAREKDVRVYVKQLGTELAKELGLSGKGEKIEEWPKEIQIREFPV